MKVLIVKQMPDEQELITIEKVLGEQVAYAIIEGEDITLREMSPLEEMLIRNENYNKKSADAEPKKENKAYVIASDTTTADKMNEETSDFEKAFEASRKK